MSHHHPPHVSDYLRILYRRRWTAAVALILVLAYGAAASLRKSPVYEASAQLLVDNERQVRALGDRTLAWRTLEGLGLARPTAELERMAELDDLVEGGIVERLALWLGAPRPVATPAGDETAWQSRQIDAFLAGVVVTRVPNSRLVNLTYRSTDPVFAAKAANALGERFLDDVHGLRPPASPDGAVFERDQVKAQRQRLAESELALQRYTEEHGTPALAARQDNAAARKVADAAAQLTRARLERLDAEAVLHRWMELRQTPDGVSAVSALRADEAAQRLWTEILDLRAKDGHLAAAGYQPESTERRRLAAGVAARTAGLQARIDRVLPAVRATLESARARETEMEGHYTAEVGRARGSDRQVVEYVALERAVMGDRHIYNHLMERARETDAGTGPGAQIVAAAEVPRRPILPERGRDLAVALLAAVLIAIGLAFGTEYLDSRIKNPDDIKTHLRLPFLGLVPAVSARHSRGSGLLLNRGVPPAFGEALRSVRTAVIFSSASEGARSVLVTSTAPSEGKTVTASNLALALAQAELRTLVIDADMRRPRIHEVFDVDQEPGLSNVLVGTESIDAAVRRTDNPFLSILPAGHLPPNPAELLGSSRCERLLEGLGSKYDWIVIDAPPVMAVTDAAVVAHAVSGVVFVVGAEMIPRRNAQTAVDQLVQARAKLVGVVLNRAEVERHAYYYAPYERKEYAPVDAPRL